MPVNRIDLLPPNAQPTERALAAAAARIEDVPVPLAALWNPATCPASLLAWVAWGLSVDHWEAGWSEARKREEVADAIGLHRVKGTRAAVDAVIDRYDALISIVEWWEMRPPGPPHTFDLVQPINDYAGAPLTAATVEAIVRDVARAKPVRSHMAVVQRLLADAGVVAMAGAKPTGFVRLAGEAAHDPDPAWSTYLLTEAGEPLQLEDGSFLEDA